jgi:uncharacterized protein (DUF433 family)
MSVGAVLPDAEIAYAHIVKTPGTMGGEPRIDGHRIRVRDVVAMRDVHGYTPEEIATVVYPQLTLGEVYSALAYYEDHREEIAGYAAREAEFVAQFQREHPALVRDLRQRDEE